jgi:hypothetical protein
MAASRKYMSEDEIEQSLLEKLTASDQSSFSDESDSSGTDDLTVGELIGVECSDIESDDVQFATVAQHSGLVSILKWKDIKEVTMISTYRRQETRMKLMKCSRLQ